MPLYFLLLDDSFYRALIAPPLAASWKQRSFAPCAPLHETLKSRIEALRDRYFAGPNESLLARVIREMPFDRHIWRALVGEVLLIAAAEMPELQTAPETLRRLLAPERHGMESGPRAPIEQVHFGSRDLTFGGAIYRPEQVGCNDADDTARLARYLQALDSAQWTAADLAALPDMDENDRVEELEFVREWFPSLRDMYFRASDTGQRVICEQA